MGVLAKLEVGDAVWLKLVSMPNTLNRAEAHPSRSAISRELQCVRFLGIVLSVASTILATFLSEMVRGRPGRGASSNMLAIPLASNLCRIAITLGREIPTRCAMSALESPLAASSTTRARRTERCSVVLFCNKTYQSANMSRTHAKRRSRWQWHTSILPSTSRLVKLFKLQDTRIANPRNLSSCCTPRSRSPAPVA
jgi:hypothetical protein